MCQVDDTQVKAKSKVAQLTEAIDRLTIAVERLDRSTRGASDAGNPWPKIAQPWGGGFPGHWTKPDPLEPCE